MSGLKPGPISETKGQLLQQRTFFGLGFGVFGGDDYGGGYFVVGVEVEELDAHRCSSRSADLLCIDADDLAELADNHHLRGLVDKLNTGDFAGFLVYVHVYSAAAAASR